jgi:hypothetical protein
VGAADPSISVRANLVDAGAGAGVGAEAGAGVGSAVGLNAGSTSVGASSSAREPNGAVCAGWSGPEATVGPAGALIGGDASAAGAATEAGAATGPLPPELIGSTGRLAGLSAGGGNVPERLVARSLAGGALLSTAGAKIDGSGTLRALGGTGAAARTGSLAGAKTLARYAAICSFDSG